VTADLREARLLEVSPNGQAIAYGTCCDDDAIYVANLDGSDARIITPEELDGYGPTWIDDETILFQGRPEGTIELGDLYVADLSTGEVTMVTDLPDERNGAWIIVSDVSPDGTTVLFHLPRREGAGSEEDTRYDLWTAPLAGGEQTMLRKNAGFAQYAADGRIVFLEHAIPFQGDAIWVMDADGSNTRRLAGDANGSTYVWPRVSPDGTMVAVGHDDGLGDGFHVDIVDIGTGQSDGLEEVAAEEPAWFGNDALIVED
jgi:Tol biopolymer transport system component